MADVESAPKEKISVSSADEKENKKEEINQNTMTGAETEIEGKEGKEEEEWEIQRNQSKSLGDIAFRQSDYPTAISHYTQALSLDPAHTVLLSNRSAAYLANSEVSKALADARACIQSDPTFIKGYTRCAAAVMKLGRFREGMNLYQKVLNELDPNSDVAKQGVDECQKQMMQQREQEKDRIKRVSILQEKGTMDEEMAKLRELYASSDEDEEDDDDDEGKDGDKNGGGNDEEKDDMDDFFSEVENVVQQTKKTSSTPDAEPTAKTETVSEKNSEPEKPFALENIIKTSTSKKQISYILQPSHTWHNLNPYHVLSISNSDALHTQCTIDQIEKRYRAISLLIHPDKNLDQIEQATLAFDELKKAMEVLRNDDRRKHVLQLISQGMKVAKKTPKHEQQPPDLSEKEWQDKCIKKVFAQLEQKRKDVEMRKKKQQEREENQEREEIEKMKKEQEYEKKWKESTRVEKRIGNWRDFQSVKKHKK